MNGDFKMPEESFGRGKVPAPATEHSHFGVILGVLILLLALIFAGLYVWSQYLQQKPQPAAPAPVASRPTDAQNKEPESTNAKADTQTLNTLSTSDELGAIKADLESTNLDTVTSDIPAIESELHMNAQ